MKKRLAQALPTLAPALFFAWVLLANLTRLSNNDIWLQLKVGADILAERAFPQVDVYSAVAAGRPFIAHEWLASVAFHVVHSAFGGAGLSVLQALVALGCAALLRGSLPKRARENGLALPLLTLSMYLVSARLTLRPHVFSLLGVAAWTFAVERWRRSGKLRALAWLVPVQCVWANLHGEAVIVPVLFAALAVVTLVIARWPRMQDEDARPLTTGDAGQLLLMSAATLAATLINPYGDRLLWFALDMGAGNDFIKRYVFEWTPTLDGRAFGLWFTWVYLVELILLWSSLFARLRRRPVFDLALALIATGLSLTAKRLVPYLAILGLPILARAWPMRRRPVVEVALGAALAALALGRGLPYLQGGDGVRTSLGFAPTLATEEVGEIARRGLTGVMFDEYVDGALIIHALHPRVRPVMDSRIDVYGRELYEEYLAAQSSPERFADYLAKYHVDLVMLSRERKGAFEWLRRRGEWRLVLQSERRFVFARDYGQLGEFQSPEQPPNEPQLQAK